MKTFKNKILAVILICILCIPATASDKLFRIGAKIGFPNVISVNSEYVLPILKHRVAPMIDFSDFSITIEDVKSSFTYFEAGLNIYLMPKGKGLYANFSHINMKTELEYSDLTSEGSTPGLTNGTASTEVKLKSFSAKFGGKFGGTFYVRPEVGFVFSPLDKDIIINATFDNNGTVYQETQTEEIPSVLRGSLIFSLGFGFAF